MKEFSLGAQVVVLYNTPTDPTAFEQYYHGTHVPIAKRIPGLRKYSVSKGPIAAAAGAAPYYFLATLDFDSMEALQAGLTSPEGQAAAGDVPNFATRGATILMYETQDV